MSKKERKKDWEKKKWKKKESQMVLKKRVPGVSFESCLISVNFL